MGIYEPYFWNYSNFLCIWIYLQERLDFQLLEKKKKKKKKKKEEKPENRRNPLSRSISFVYS